jgi:hypothetical protein
MDHQNSWDLWMFIPLKLVFIGIDRHIMMLPSDSYLLKPPTRSENSYHLVWQFFTVWYRKSLF